MAANPYTHLGWNPAPGTPFEVTELELKVKTASRTLDSTYRQIEQLLGESSYWEGDAADAFRDALDGDIPTYVKNAARSLDKAATALSSWNATLTSHRDLAKKYDEEAGQRKSAAEAARKAHDQARQNPDLNLAGRTFPSQEEADTATARLRSAESALNDASTELEQANQAYQDVISKAKELEAEHEAKAETVAKRLDEADDKLAPKEPGWLSKAASAIGDALKAIGEGILEHAGTISAIAGLLALLPTPFAPVFLAVAVGASALSMAKNLSSEDFRDSLRGEYGLGEGVKAWAGVVGDSLGMVPGVGALARSGSEVGLASAVAREGGEALAVGAKADQFVKGIVPAFTYKALDGATSAGLKEFALDGANAAVNIVSSAESFGLLPEDGVGHETNEYSKIAAGAASAPDDFSEIFKDTGELLRGIRL
ncbi:putative T7SS-secreted protein [Streptomyces sp. BYX5S]